MARADVTPEMLSEFLSYDAETGALTWNKRADKWFRSGRYGQASEANRWNKIYAGNPAFTSINDGGYLNGRVFNFGFRAHRVAWAIFYGKWPDDQIDHINGDRRDNRIANLREVTNAVNGRNQKLRSTNKTGAIGVHWSKVRKKWHARIMLNGKRTDLGCYDTFEEAVKVREEASRRLDFHPNHGREAAKGGEG